MWLANYGTEYLSLFGPRNQPVPPRRGIIETWPINIRTPLNDPDLRFSINGRSRSFLRFVILPRRVQAVPVPFAGVSVISFKTVGQMLPDGKVLTLTSSTDPKLHDIWRNVIIFFLGEFIFHS